MDPSDLYDGFQNSTDYIAVDTRRPNGYSKEHIPSAINLPHREMTEESTRTLISQNICLLLRRDRL